MPTAKDNDPFLSRYFLARSGEIAEFSNRLHRPGEGIDSSVSDGLEDAECNERRCQTESISIE